MKYFRLLLAVIALGITGIFGYEFYNELQKPAEGMAVVVEGEPQIMEEEVMMEEVTVMTEEESMEAEEPMIMEEPVMMEEVFMPIAFDGKLKNLVTIYKGRLVKLKGAYSVEKYDLKASKGVVVDGDLYFKSGKDFYVIHKGELIKL